MRIQHLCLFFLVLLSFSCRQPNEVKDGNVTAKPIANNQPSGPNPSQIDPHQVLPGGLPSGHPNVNPAEDVNAPVSLEGKVLEVTQVEKFTYLKLSSTSGEVWSAVPKVEISVGQNVNIVSASWVENFESKTLNKKFEKILFGQLELKK